MYKPSILAVLGEDEMYISSIPTAQQSKTRCCKDYSYSETLKTNVVDPASACFINNTRHAASLEYHCSAVIVFEEN